MIGMMAWPMGLLRMEEVVIEIIIGLMVAMEFTLAMMMLEDM